jgi:hypothetical protein
MEKRNKKRLDVCLDAVWDGSRGNYQARVTDFSADGCFVDSISDAVTGEILHLKVQLLDGEWLDLTGEVAHTFPRIGFGVRFVDLKPLQRQKLLSLLEHLNSTSDRPLARISDS